MRFAILLLFASTTFAQRIDSISPSQGPIAGGTAVTIDGASFTGAIVSIDGNAITPQSQTDTRITIVMPPHDNGYAIVRAGSAATTYLYLPPALKDLPAGFITTVAGVGVYYGDYRSALDASISAGQIDYGPDGSLYLADLHHNRVVRVRPDGILEPFAGTGRAPEPATFKTPAPPLDISLGYARSIVVEKNGDVDIADDPANRVWRVEAATGLARVIAGDGGPAGGPQLNEPNYLAGDKAGTLWFVDWGNSRIRRIDPDGSIVTICGTGTAGLSGDGGPATQATFNTGNPDSGALAYDPAGFLYLADTANHRIRRIDLHSGIITTFAGPVDNGTFRGLIVAANGDVYYDVNSQIFHVTRDGTLVESWGSPVTTLARTYDGTKLSDMLMGTAIGFAFDARGNLLYADDDVNRVMRMNKQTGLLETVVSAIGPGVFGENGPALAAAPIEKIGPNPDLVVSPAGELTFSGRRIRKLGLDGRLSVIASLGLAMTSGDGIPATQASYITGGLDVDPAGNLYAATFINVAQIDHAGILRRVAGVASPQACGLDGDGGPARSARLCQPWDMALDRDGNIFIADTNNNRIRRVDAKTQIMTTVAGSGPINGFENYFHGSDCGDGGPARQACLDTPVGIAVSPSGELYVAEWDRVRKIDRNGIISTVAGLSGFDFLSFDAAGNLYTRHDNSIVRITPSGTMQVLAGRGDGSHGFSGDGGPASDALLIPGGGIGIDAEGNLYFVDGGNRRIRAVRYGAVLAPPNATITATASGATIKATVRDGAGNLAPNVRVEFTTPSSGASCSAPFAITDASGVATTTCSPNCIAGTYAVTARALASPSTATVAFANDGRCHHRAAPH